MTKDTHRCGARNGRTEGKRPRTLYTHKNWKFERLLEEVKKLLTESRAESGPGRLYVSAEWMSKRFRSKLKMMNRVVSHLRKENLLVSKVNFTHDGCWSTTLYGVKDANSGKT